MSDFKGIGVFLVTLLIYLAVTLSLTVLSGYWFWEGSYLWALLPGVLAVGLIIYAVRAVRWR